MFDPLPSDPDAIAVTADPEPPPAPLERLETQICEPDGHLAAATCRFVVLLGDLEARRGWASWEILKRTSGTSRPRSARQPCGAGGAPLGWSAPG